MTNIKEIAYLFIRYIQQVLINEKKNYLRNAQNKPLDLVYESSYFESIEYSPSDIMSKLSELNYEMIAEYIEDVAFSNAIASLSTEEKFILFERYVACKKDPVIGKELGVTSQAISKKRKRILRKLRNSLENE